MGFVSGTGKIDRRVKIRSVVAGSKSVGAGASKYLEIDSGTYGAEILSIIATGAWSTNKWVVGLYIPPLDGFLSPEAEDKKDEFDWSEKDEAGLIPGIIAFPYNMFLKLNNTGTGAGSATINDVVVVYHSKGALTLTWET